MTAHRRATLLALPLFLAACGPDVDVEPPPDDAGASDAGVFVDGGSAADAGAQVDAGSLPDAGTPQPDAGTPEHAFIPPDDIFFVGNSFTFGGPVPTLVRNLATYAGFPTPHVEFRAIGGQTLQGHRADVAAEGAPARVAEGWDVVVLQELSTRPTDQVGPAEQFKQDATWFYDLAKSAAPHCEVVLYETWARRAGHPIYDTTFTGPAQMQAELRYHYNDAADRYIPLFSTAARKSDVRVASAGDAWELQLASGEPPRLHAADDYHANDNGAYLNALVIYSSIYGRRAGGLIPLLSVDEATAQLLQQSADATTGAEGFGAVRGPPLPITAWSTVRLDVGPLPVADWFALTQVRGTVAANRTVEDEPASVLATTWGFTGFQEGGSAVNTLGMPADVSRDSLWVGSFDGHAVALGMESRVVLRGLEPGPYRIELFASRNGDDGGLGRLTRYRIGSETRDLDPVDNTSRTAVFDSVVPDARGEIVIRTGVSPAGSARFAYLGAMWVTAED